jgi:hypothetical protein
MKSHFCKRITFWTFSLFAFSQVQAMQPVLCSSLLTDSPTIKTFVAPEESWAPATELIGSYGRFIRSVPPSISNKDVLMPLLAKKSPTRQAIYLFVSSLLDERPSVDIEAAQLRNQLIRVLFNEGNPRSNAVEMIGALLFESDPDSILQSLWRDQKKNPVREWLQADHSPAKAEDSLGSLVLSFSGNLDIEQLMNRVQSERLLAGDVESPDELRWKLLRLEERFETLEAFRKELKSSAAKIAARGDAKTQYVKDYAREALRLNPTHSNKETIVENFKAENFDLLMSMAFFRDFEVYAKTYESLAFDLYDVFVRYQHLPQERKRIAMIANERLLVTSVEILSLAMDFHPRLMNTPQHGIYARMIGSVNSSIMKDMLPDPDFR